MYPVLFEAFGRQIYSYGVLIIIGAVSAWILVRMLAGKKNKDISLVFLICICGGLIGAFILRPLTKIPEIIINWERFKVISFNTIISYLFGEIVFYGGLIGGVLAMLIYCKYFNIPILSTADLLTPAAALAHGFGRIGCFLGGCCFGVATDISNPFAVIYPHHAPLQTINGTTIPIGAPAGVPLLAVQLIEAAGLFLITAILTIVFVINKKRTNGFIVCLYGLLYPVLRFILEYYRGDDARGIYGPFSISQYISIAIFLTAAVMLLLINKKLKTRLKI